MPGRPCLAVLDGEAPTKGKVPGADTPGTVPKNQVRSLEVDHTKVADDEQERRYRASQSMRRHEVTQGRCPVCGATIPASLVGFGCHANTKRSK